MIDRHSTTRRGFAKTVAATTLAAWAAAPSSAAEKPRVALALLGAAHIHTPMFLQVLRSREDVKIVSVWDHDAGRAERWAKECDARPVKSVQDVLSDREVAGVVVLSETLLHADLAIAAAKAKKHLFVEKPLGVGAADAAQIAEAVEKSGVLFTTGYHLRTIPKYLFIKENLAQGHFGKIVRAHCSVTNDCVLQGAFDQEFRWTTDGKWGALGGFADLGTHALDTLMWMLGDIESVAAEVRTVTNRYPNCDEAGQAMLRFASGASGTIAAGWVEPDNPVSFSLVGTEGHAVVFNDRLYLRTKKVPGADGARPWGKLPPGPDHPLLQFVSAVSGQKNLPLVPVREAAARVKVMEAMYLAARERKWVAVG
jgi:predicted dehydrogenase